MGKIGERLQITANYDTESTFDFQNLVKIEFNPPRLADTSEIIPNINNSNLSDASDRIIDFGQKISDTKQKIGDYQSTFNDAKRKIMDLKSKADGFSKEGLMG